MNPPKQMADNFLEYQREAFEARKAKKERERKKRLRKYLEAYKKKLAQQKADQKESAEEWALTRDGRSKNPRVGTCLGMWWESRIRQAEFFFVLCHK